MEFFDPSELSERIHIIGCGSVGSTLAEQLARLGITKFSLYDFDVVEKKNIVNQMFFHQDIHKPKVEALARIIREINPDIPDGDLILEPEGYNGQMLSGYVFLAVDNIEVRRKICEDNKLNRHIKAMFDIRTGLTDAQHFAADWNNRESRTAFMKSMDFTHEEAKAATPVSACGVELSVASTIRLIVSLAVTNFMNFTKGQPLKKFIMSDAFAHTVEAFE